MTLNINYYIKCKEMIGNLKQTCVQCAQSNGRLFGAYKWDRHGNGRAQFLKSLLLPCISPSIETCNECES